MCGIVGYVGAKVATPLLIDGLKRLEYRGYDSAGVAIMNGKGVETRKAAGKIAMLEAVLTGNPVSGTTGIAHTRWATHGAPNECNAHPHVDCSGKLAVVHNGIIENATPLRKMLEQHGHRFVSETDTEVLAHLIEASFSGNLEEAVIEALHLVEGTYGIAVISELDPNKIVAARKGSPLLIGLGREENYIASDVAAILKHTRDVIYLDDGELAVITADTHRVIDLDAVTRPKGVAKIDWELDQIERGGFAHFMLKEIFEQPQTIENAMRGRLVVEDGTSKLGGINLTHEQLLHIDQIVITACGTSWHSALIGEMMIEELCRIPVEVEYASEFRYRNPIVTDRTLCIVISQSGETADTLAAMREAKRRGARTLGIVNVVGSTIAREDDGGIYIHAGPEIGVASTKAFTSQVIALALLTLKLARKRDLSVVRGREIAQAMLALPGQVRDILERAPEIERIADQFGSATNFLYLGRGYNCPVALEGALKLKEVSYVHAEGYAAGELKHGPISLLDAEVPLVAIGTKSSVQEKLISTVMEGRARDARVMAV
ncbi:MAG TPA: glutamine--fructose-6-phosphate transaminase (isomerizing), partial [Gemmatimonadaceae bacterium]|nr:glutamine--fructose-6-phosphate transaminase (isomerizing) [Gemmatimonadaceae bacterium]